MYDAIAIHSLLKERRPGHSLPRGLYCDMNAFEFDLEAIFARTWIMAGFECELPDAGSYLATEIGLSPILLIRNRQGEIVAFHNSCRHRGAQICPSGSGKTPRLICPYHQWSYGLDGKLLKAQKMPEEFPLEDHGLLPIKVETVAGCIYVSLSAEAPPFAAFGRSLEQALSPHNLRNVKLAYSAVLDEQANWKLVMENGRECHHCAVGHPELKATFPLSIGDQPPSLDEASGTPFFRQMAAVGMAVPPEAGDWWQIARFPFNEGILSYSTESGFLSAKLLVEENGGDVGSLRWATEPNNFCHATGDMAFMFNANPTGPLSTRVTAKWFVHKDAVEGVDYHVEQLIHMWDQTNRQDRDLAENNQRGVLGMGYRPGPYSPDGESYLIRFADWYCSTALAYAEEAMLSDGIARIQA